MIETQDIVTEIVKKSQERALPCIFCQTATSMRGVYLDVDKRFGAVKEGMTKTIIYAVCPVHSKQSPVLMLLSRFN